MGKRWTPEQRHKEKTRAQAVHQMHDAQDRMRHMEVVMACLLDHYLNCYDGSADALAYEAERLVPDWRHLMELWEPTEASI